MGDVAAKVAVEEHAPEHTGQRRERGLALVLLCAALGPVVFPMSRDGVDDVRFLLAVAAMVLVGPATMDRDWLPRVRQCLGTAGSALLGALVLALILATVTSNQPILSLIGGYQRHNGLVAHLVMTVLLLLTATVLTLRRLEACARALAAGATAAVLYWLAQRAGWDPLGILPPPDAYSGSGVFSSTLGNPNFAGAFVAMALPAAAWAAWRAQRLWRRAAWAVAVGLLLAAVIGSDALQAVVAAAAGMAVLTLAILASRDRRWVRVGLGLGALAVVVVAIGLFGHGPLGWLGREETFVSRTWDWTAAVRMLRAQPLTGVGLTRFGGYVRAFRPPGDIINYGWETFADAAHSVPLDLAAGGGIPLMATYAAWVGFVGLRLVRGLRRLEGAPLLLLGGFGGVWAAYQVQSLVSIDVAQLAIANALAAGAILALTARFQGEDTAPPSAVPSAARIPLAARVALGAIGTAVLLGAWTQTLADILLMRSDSDSNAAAVAYNETAVRIYPFDPHYWHALGASYEVNEQYEEALTAYLRAVRGDPREVYYRLYAATMAEHLGRRALEMSLLEAALHIEPQAAEVKVRAADAAWRLKHRARALELLEAALAFDPDNTDARALRSRIMAAPR